MRRALLSSPTRRARLPRLGLIALAVVTGGSIAVTAVALNLQLAATNYVTAESQWSKGRAEAVQALDTYALSGDRDQLTRARSALAVPLGDRQARLALEEDPPDRAAAREGFLDGRNAPEDVPRMIWFYLVFSDVAPFGDAVRVWREADRHVLALEQVADELQRLHEGPATPTQPRIAQLRAEIEEISFRIRPLERALTRLLAEGVRWLNRALFVITVGSFLVLALIAGLLVAWSVRRIRANDRSVRRTFEQAGVGMARVDGLGRLVDVNDALCDLAGRTRAQLLETTLLELIGPERRPRAGEVSAFLQPGEGTTFEYRLVRGDGRQIWVRSTLSQVDLGRRQARELFATFDDVSEAKRLTEELSHQARHDMLTGLVNRYEFERRTEQAHTSAQRRGVTHALCYLDLDQFKVVNDTAGHAAGDALLTHLAHEITSHVRATDTVGRLGGDEFAILLDRTPLDTAVEVAEALRARIAATEVPFEGRRFRTSCSIGVVSIDGDDEDAGAILRRADVACYIAKDRGRDRVHAYAESDEAQAARQGEMAWVDRMRDALADDRLELYAQRIVARADPDELRYELLVRLRDVDGRLHVAGAFLPAAERYGMAGDIDRWVVRTALETLVRHPAHVQALSAVHVNVSPRSVSDPAFAEQLLGVLDATGFPPARLCIEITETAAMTSLPDAERFLTSLRARGVRVALDDFGSDLSSFAYLKTASVDLVKLDGLLVRDMDRNPLDETLVRSVHDLAAALGKRTVAEFVEREQVRTQLHDIGVDYLQGYALHRPVPWGDLLAQP
ncbi:MAG: EAL domain-containing protein [Trueperaceae bacterium]|nr:EAL domain-containing protein [Trueperaceae bacterium]